MVYTDKFYLDQAGLSAFWAKAKAYIDNGDKNSMSATGVDSAIDTKLNGLSYTYADKKIALKNGETLIGEVDCSDFVKDSFLKSGSLVDVNDKKVLRLILNTIERPGTAATETQVDIDVTDLFNVSSANITLADGTTLEAAVTKLQADVTTLTSRVKTLEDSADAYKAADNEVYNAIKSIPVADVEALFA